MTKSCGIGLPFPRPRQYSEERNIQERQAHTLWRAARIKLRKGKEMDTNTLLIIVLVIFLFGGFGYYGRGRWF